MMTAFARLIIAASIGLLIWQTRAGAGTDLAAAGSAAFSQPAHLTPRAVNGLFTSVTRAGDNLVAVGERGWIIVSGDNGLSWHQVPAPANVTLTKVVFATPQMGWAVGGMGVVLHTADGGLHWTRQFDGLQAGAITLAAAQADVKRFGANDQTTANLQSAQALAHAGASLPFLDVYAPSTGNAIVAGAFGMAFSSTDGGDSWQSIADSLPNPDGSHIYQVMQDRGNLAVVGELGLLLFGPPGKPLATLTSPFQGSFFGELFTPDHAWIVFGLQGTILRSSDDGAHWAPVSAGVSAGIDSGMVLANGDILLGNEAGQLLLSHDDGRTYTASQVDEPVVGLAQAADGAIIVVGPSGPRRIVLAKIAGA